jgi:hypothetical protein
MEIKEKCSPPQKAKKMKKKLAALNMAIPQMTSLEEHY